MWRIWKSRNDFLFQKINRQPVTELRKGLQDVNEWIEVNQAPDATYGYLNMPPSRLGIRSKKWIPPPSGWLKCNFDSGYVQERLYTETGWIL